MGADYHELKGTEISAEERSLLGYDDGLEVPLLALALYAAKSMLWIILPGMKREKSE